MVVEPSALVVSLRTSVPVTVQFIFVLSANFHRVILIGDVAREVRERLVVDAMLPA